jgi:hypothetical protein
MKKFLGLDCDTIFSGDWSAEGKVHTLENLFRVIGGGSLFLAGMYDKWWLALIGVPLIGIVLRLTPDRKHLDLRMW